MNIWIVIGGIFLIEGTLIFGLLYLRSLLLPPDLETEGQEDRWAREYHRYQSPIDGYYEGNWNG